MNYYLISLIFIQIFFFIIIYLIKFFGQSTTTSLGSVLNKDIYFRHEKNSESNYYNPSVKYLNQQGRNYQFKYIKIYKSDVLLQIIFFEGVFRSNYDNFPYEGVVIGTYYSPNILILGDHDLKRTGEYIYDLNYPYETDDEFHNYRRELYDDDEEFSYKSKMRKYLKLEKVRTLIKIKVFKCFRQICRKHLKTLKLFKILRIYCLNLFLKNRLILPEKNFLIKLNSNFHKVFCKKTFARRDVLKAVKIKRELKFSVLKAIKKF